MGRPHLGSIRCAKASQLSSDDSSGSTGILVVTVRSAVALLLAIYQFISIQFHYSKAPHIGSYSEQRFGKETLGNSAKDAKELPQHP